MKYTAGTPTAPQDFFVAPGDYAFRVIEASEEKSQSGNDMIKLKLRPIKKDGTDGPALFDYLVFSKTSHWKIDAFLKSCGKHPGDGVEADLDTDDMIGWEGEATLSVDTYDGKKSNKVAAYLFEDF